MSPSLILPILWLCVLQLTGCPNPLTLYLSPLKLNGPMETRWGCGTARGLSHPSGSPGAATCQPGCCWDLQLPRRGRQPPAYRVPAAGP